MNSVTLTSWFALAVAIVFGVLGTIAMKLSHGLKKTIPVFLLGLFYTISFVGLTFAIKHLNLSVVYAVWSGMGTILVFAIGIIFFKETLSLRKIIFLSLIVLGVIGIH